MQPRIGRNRGNESSKEWTFADVSQAWIEAKGARFAPSLLADKVLSRAIEQTSLVSVSMSPQTGHYQLDEKLISFPADVERMLDPSWLDRLVEHACAEEVPVTQILETQSKSCAETRVTVTALPLSEDGLFVTSLLLIFTSGVEERRARISLVGQAA